MFRNTKLIESKSDQYNNNNNQVLCEYLNDTPWVAKRKGIIFFLISSRYMLF